MTFPSNIPNKAGMQLMSVADVANRLNVSESVIYKWVSEDKLPQSVKLGNRHRWRQSDIETWIDEGGTDAQSSQDC